MEDGRRRPQRMGDLSLMPIAVMPAALAADLRLSATETPDGVSLVWTCSSELFDGDTAERFAERFDTLIRDVTRHPHRRIGDLDVIPERERALLRTFGAPLSPGRAAVCVHTLFEQQAHPHARCRGTDLRRRCHRLRPTRSPGDRRRTRADARRDQARVTCRRVPDALRRSRDSRCWAVLKAGAIWLPLDPDDPPARVAAILDDSGAGFVLTNESLRGRVPAGSSSVVCLEELADTPVEGQSASASVAASAIPIDAAACLLYTCDAHRLRAAEVSHRTLSALVVAVMRQLELTQEDVALSISPPSLDVSVVELLAPLATGAQLVLGDGDVGHEPERLAEMAATTAATLVIGPTMLWAGVITTPGPWTQLKAICIGGLPAPEASAELVARTAGAWVTHGFPVAGIWTTLRRLSDSEPAGLLGRPFGPARVRILDDDLSEAPLGVVGQLYVIHGLDGAWHRTGERARWKGDGALELVKVRDREVHVNGFRVDLDDVSSVLRSHPAVRDAAVVLQTQGADNARLVAHVVPREGVASTATELRDEARRVLPAGIVLRSFIEVETIPRTADGQLDLEPQGSAGATSGDDYVPPQTPTEILLAELWQDALALPRVGAHENFFELGGYSLLCFQVLERIERATGHRVSPRLLLLDSLRQVSARLDEMAATGDAPRSLQGPPPRLGFFRRLKRLLPGVIGLGA